MIQLVSSRYSHKQYKSDCSVRYICFLTVPLYKHTHLDIDVNNKSDRIEWGHLRYQSIYKVDHSYELVVQWVASSGSIVADLVNKSLSFFSSLHLLETNICELCTNDIDFTLQDISLATQGSDVRNTNGAHSQ